MKKDDLINSIKMKYQLDVMPGDIYQVPFQSEYFEELTKKYGHHQYYILVSYATLVEDIMFFCVSILDSTGTIYDDEIGWYENEDFESLIKLA